MEQQAQQKPTSGTKEIRKPGKKRGGGKGITLLLLLLFVATIALFVWAEQQRREAVGRLQETEQRLEEIQSSTQQSGQERAQQVLEQVRQHIELPTDPEPTVATIVDVDRLRETSSFYDKAENGNNLIITENRAILFDSERNIIVDVVPVQITQQQGNGDTQTNGTPPPSETNTDESPDTSPSPSPTPAE